MLVTSEIGACETFVEDSDNGNDTFCTEYTSPLLYWGGTVILALGQFLALGRQALKKEKYYLLKETEVSAFLLKFLFIHCIF